MILDDLDPRLASKIGHRLKEKIGELEQEVGDEELWAEKQLQEAVAEAAAHPDDAQAH